MPTIRLKEETYEKLKSWAIPLEDTPNDAIERVLDMAEAHRDCLSKTEPGDREPDENS